MKKLLIFLFSLFFLSAPSVFADDISDFEIEGISIGDSLLDYMTKDEILEGIELNKDGYSYLKEPNKYVEVYLFNYSSTYEAGLSFFIKNNSTNKYINNKNEKYTILSIRGMKNYIEDFDSCIQKRDEIAADLSHVFPLAQKAEDDARDAELAAMKAQLDAQVKREKIDADLRVQDTKSAIELQALEQKAKASSEKNYTELVKTVRESRTPNGEK